VEAAGKPAAPPPPPPAAAGPAPATAPGDETRRKLEPFFPGRTDRLPEPLLAVMSGPVLTRGALAVLLTGDGRSSLAKGLESSMADEPGRLRPPEDVESRPARLRHSEEVFGLYRGEPSPFPDLADGHYALNAARIAVDLDVIVPLPDGRFAPDQPLTMDEGIHAVTRLVPALAGDAAE
jgi:hypothetical protein